MEKKIILQKCKKVPANKIRCFICVQLSSMLIKTLKRRNTILNRFENYISLSHPVLTFDHMARHSVSARRLQLGWKSGGSLSGEREVYGYGAQHNKSTSQTMLFISQRAFLCPFFACSQKYTHAGTPSLTDLRREVGKALESRLHSLSSLISF